MKTKAAVNQTCVGHEYQASLKHRGARGVDYDDDDTDDGTLNDRVGLIEGLKIMDQEVQLDNHRRNVAGDTVVWPTGKQRKNLKASEVEKERLRVTVNEQQRLKQRKLNPKVRYW